MSDYGDFARFYDRFTQNVNYPARARYFDAVIQKYNPDANRRTHRYDFKHDGKSFLVHKKASLFVFCTHHNIVYAESQ